MILDILNAGTLQVKEGDQLMVCDPGYGDASDICVKVIKDVEPGNYICKSYVGNCHGWGRRPWESMIVLDDKDVLEMADDDNNWKLLDECIPVDAGMAGYFINKPSFDEKAWDRFCEYVLDKKNYANRITETFIKNDDKKLDGDWIGFWTESGCGDGVYPLYALKRGEKIVGLKLRF